MRVAQIFVNPIEYHGPHLPLKTDYEISRGLSTEFLARAKKIFPELQIVREIEIHKGSDAAKGPGTEETPLKELKRLVLEASEAVLQNDKPDLVLFMTFHGAPKQAAAIEAGVQYCARRGVKAYNPFNFVLRLLLEYTPELADPMLPLIPDETFRAKYRAHLPEDFHGGLFETSVLLRLNPAVVKNHQQVKDCEDRVISWPWKFIIASTRTLGFKTLSSELAIAADALGWRGLKSYPGHTGAPRFATPEIGDYFVGVILNKYEQGLLKLVKENHPSPKPTMQWTVSLP